MKKILGITLLELLVTVAIISITLLLAIPAYRHFIMQNQTKTNLNRLVSALQFSRTQAILKRHRILVCPYISILKCGNDWAAGLIIYDKKAILKIIDPFKDAVIIWNRRQNIIEFLADGRLKSQNGKFIYYNKQSQQDSHLAVILSITGRIRLRAA